MNIVSICIAAVVILSAQAAFALERQGSSTIDFNGHKITNTFSTTYDPATRVFARKGILTMQNGKTGSYEINGRCTEAPLTCDITGSGKGPMGRQWSGHGTLDKEGTKTMLKATLTGPAGQTFTIDREVDGDMFPTWQ